MGILTKIEDLIGETVESWFDTKKGLQPLDIGRMARKVLANSRKKMLDKTYIANLVDVILDKKTFKETEPLHDEMGSQLRGTLLGYAEEMDYHTIGDITVRIIRDEKMSKKGVKIVARMVEDERRGRKLTARLYFEKEDREIVIFHSKELTIGRDESCDVVIKDDRVSERHAEVKMHEHEITVSDLKSTHGTEVCGQKINSTEIGSGDTVTIAVIHNYPVEVVKRDKVISSIKLIGDRKTYMLLKSGLLIGRKGPDIKIFDIALEDGAVSARKGHAKIEFRKGTATIVDLKSTNGTLVNGKKIERKELESRDKVQLGETEFYFYNE